MARLERPRFRNHFSTTLVVEVVDYEEGDFSRKLELAETSHVSSMLVHFRRGCWVITHKPTGLLVNKAHSREQALSMCATYDMAPIDWSGGSHEIKKQLKEQFGSVGSRDLAPSLRVPNQLHMIRSEQPLRTSLVTPVEVRPRTVAPS